MPRRDKHLPSLSLSIGRALLFLFFTSIGWVIFISLLNMDHFFGGFASIIVGLLSAGVDPNLIVEIFKK